MMNLKTPMDILAEFIAQAIMISIDGATFVYGYSFFNIEQFISYKTIGLIIIILAINCAINAFFCYLNNKRMEENMNKSKEWWNEMINNMQDWEEFNEDDTE